MFWIGIVLLYFIIWLTTYWITNNPGATFMIILLLSVPMGLIFMSLNDK